MRPKSAPKATGLVYESQFRRGWSVKAGRKNAVKLLEDDVKKGAQGLKIFKNLGLNSKDESGHRVRVDDPRLDPIWAKCGELGVPVLIHTADPKSFWDPMDRYNERWLELKLHGGRKRPPTTPFPGTNSLPSNIMCFASTRKQRSLPLTWAGIPTILTKLDSLMTVFPNMNVEIGAVIAELGRQPRASRTFFEKYQDRILFGKDSWVPSEYATYFRVLETDDEYFPYHKKYHAFWRMYGMGLPDEVLKKVYYKNALRIIPGLDKSQFPE